MYLVFHDIIIELVEGKRSLGPEQSWLCCRNVGAAVGGVGVRGLGEGVVEGRKEGRGYVGRGEARTEEGVGRQGGWRRISGGGKGGSGVVCVEVRS